MKGNKRKSISRTKTIKISKNSPNVTIPPMVGPMWLRVAYSLGSDYVLVVVSEDLPRGPLVVICVISYVPVGCVSCHVSLPPAVARVPFYPIAP